MPGFLATTAGVYIRRQLSSIPASDNFQPIGDARRCGKTELSLMDQPVAHKWHSLSLFAARFEQNLAALAGADEPLAGRLRQFVPPQPLWIAAEGDHVF